MPDFLFIYKSRNVNLQQCTVDAASAMYAGVFGVECNVLTSGPAAYLHVNITGQETYVQRLYLPPLLREQDEERQKERKTTKT